MSWCRSEREPDGTTLDYAFEVSFAGRSTLELPGKTLDYAFEVSFVSCSFLEQLRQNF
jgi:hypothetical protein